MHFPKPNPNAFPQAEPQCISPIVGDEKWRDDALAFTAKGFRPTAIEFFPESRLGEARKWLNA